MVNEYGDEYGELTVPVVVSAMVVVVVVMVIRR